MTLVTVLSLTVVGSSGCAITLMAMMPGSGQYQRTLPLVGMMLDIGIGYLIAGADEDATSDEVFVNGLLYGTLLFGVDYMMFNALSGDIMDMVDEANLDMGRDWGGLCEAPPGTGELMLPMLSHVEPMVSERLTFREAVKVWEAAGRPESARQAGLH